MAAIRKYAKTTNGFALSVYRSLTDKMTAWRGDFTKEIKEIDAIADGIGAKFKKMEEEKLKNIGDLLDERLEWHRSNSSIKQEFHTLADLRPMLKLSGTLTDKGALTTKAGAFIKAIADGELASQLQYENRIMILENRCLRSEINPPLTHQHLGVVMYADDDIFNAKVDELVSAEILRRAEMAARIEKQNAADNQKKIDDALRDQQAEANRIASENAKKAEPEPEAKQPPALMQTVDTVIAQNRLAKDDRKNPPVVQSSEAYKEPAKQPGKRTAKFSVSFEVVVSERVGDRAVYDHFLTKLPDDIKAMIKSFCVE
jgi:Fic family protein